MGLSRCPSSTCWMTCSSVGRCMILEHHSLQTAPQCTWRWDGMTDVPSLSASSSGYLRMCGISLPSPQFYLLCKPTTPLMLVHRWCIGGSSAFLYLLFICNSSAHCVSSYLGQCVLTMFIRFICLYHCSSRWHIIWANLRTFSSLIQTLGNWCWFGLLLLISVSALNTL